MVQLLIGHYNIAHYFVFGQPKNKYIIYPDVQGVPTKYTTSAYYTIITGKNKLIEKENTTTIQL